ncbi:hypothetical protein PFICI_02956 [Pestalotiopsis fici W106-1]|uniref:Uncharacterized protein n=1 Tax=Pestalotiopsis fici (strain W106-1 / CGMCC3.15140) TaxID=1229662 RepID=W3XI58_PESFW|nr:uncharacterized protein PFICI_02956 [Pestalotiopsis fici W106-1]ETS84931.1 hypothetical protein PFICI_02956 [Pestalotiopsis fici W106-1]
MLSKLIIAALVQAIMAKPITPVTQTTTMRGQRTVTHTRPTITYATPDESIIFEDFPGATATFSSSSEPEFTLDPRAAKFAGSISVDTIDVSITHHSKTLELPTTTSDLDIPLETVLEKRVQNVVQAHKGHSTSANATWV